jgi:hypothetical protein
MSDTTDAVARGRRRWQREHGDPRTREFDPAEVSADAIERGRAEWAARSGNRSALAAIAPTDDQRRDP